MIVCFVELSLHNQLEKQIYSYNKEKEKGVVTVKYKNDDISVIVIPCTFLQQSF